MQVSVDHGGDPEPAVPVGGPVGAAPHGELGVPQDLGGVTVQGVVVDEHRRQFRWERGQSALGVRDPRPAPGLAARVRVGVQQELVVADHAGAVRVGQPLVHGGAPVGQERVVVEQEERCDDRRAARPLPHRVGVFGGGHPQLTADLDQVLVARDAAQGDRVLGMRPQFVVAGGPDDPAEAVREGAEGPADVGDGLRDVAGDQEPVVVGAGPHLLDQRPVLRVSDVQVADGPQLPPATGRRRHPPPLRRARFHATRSHPPPRHKSGPPRPGASVRRSLRSGARVPL